MFHFLQILYEIFRVIKIYRADEMRTYTSNKEKNLKMKIYRYITEKYCYKSIFVTNKGM